MIQDRRAMLLGILGWATAVGMLTLAPTGFRNSTDYLYCVVCGDRGVADALLNVLLFLPLGYIGTRYLRSKPRALILALMGSLCIETLQFWIPGRFPSVGDVIMNVLGGASGIAISGIASRLRRGSTKTHRNVWVAICFASASLTIAPGVLTIAAFPRSTYVGQWTPSLGHLEAYSGTLLDARLGSVPLPPWTVPQDTVRAFFLSGRSLALRYVVGTPPTTRLASIFSIHDTRQREILLVGQYRYHILLRYRTWAAAARFDQPPLIVFDAPVTTAPGDTVALHMAYGPGQPLCITQTAQQRTVEDCTLGFTVGSGWGFFKYPTHLARVWIVALNTLWVTGLVLVPAWFGPTRRSGLVGGAVITIVAVLAPLVFALQTTPLNEWLGMAAGLGAGLWLQQRYRLSNDDRGLSRS